MNKNWMLVGCGGGVIHEYECYENEEEDISIKIHRPPENHTRWFWDIIKNNKIYWSSTRNSDGYKTKEMAFNRATEFVEYLDSLNA